MTRPSRYGGEIPVDVIRCELSGPAAAPVIAMLGGISAGSHVVATRDDPTPGWWQEVAGHPVIGARYRVLGMRFVEVRGAPTDTDDQADALAAALDLLGIDRLHAIVGASYGGMVALAFAARHPERVGRLVVLCAAHESHPMATAGRVLQRRVVELGLSTGRGREALALARGIAITSYRSAEEFAARFGERPDAAVPAQFPVAAYLEHHGDRFTTTFTPERFLALSESIDLHRVDPARVGCDVTLVASTTDTLVPAWQLDALHCALRSSRLVDLPSIYGHDAFLKEAAAIVPIIASALQEDVR